MVACLVECKYSVVQFCCSVLDGGIGVVHAVGTNSSGCIFRLLGLCTCAGSMQTVRPAHLQLQTSAICDTDCL